MLLLRRKADELSRGYEIAEVCFFLRRSQQELDKAGILKRLKKTYPYGRKNPLYDAEQVKKLEINLLRHDGLVAFKVLQPDAPLIRALEPGYSDDLDCKCPECGEFALGDPRTPEDERAALQLSNSWPRLLWCFACDFVEITYKMDGEKPQHRLLGESLPEKIT